MANLFRANKKGSGGLAIDSLTVTQMPTKTYYVVNETLNLTGLVVTATFADGVTADVTSAITTSPADGDTLTTEGTIPVTVTYQGATTSFNITCVSIPASLEDATWDQIQKAVQDGTLSQFASEGDTKTVTIGNYTYHMQLASINDGTGTAGTYYPNHTADFISVELMDSLHNMNDSRTNTGGWNSCKMRTYLNSTVYPTLPTDLKSVIIEKAHMRTSGDGSTNLISASDKLWLPTDWEVFGSATESGESATYNKHYSIFSTGNSRKKHKVDSVGTNEYWFLSSPILTQGSLGYGFKAVNPYSGSSESSDSASPRGVVLGLRIG